MTLDKKLLITQKFSTKFDDLWCYYNKQKMFYPARLKKITVDQSKVLKKSIVPCVFW